MLSTKHLEKLSEHELLLQLIAQQEYTNRQLDRLANYLDGIDQIIRLNTKLLPLSKSQKQQAYKNRLALKQDK